MQLLQILAWLEKVELEMASFYQWLSERFADDTEASGFFFRMCIQERSHANLLQYGRKIAVRHPRAFEPQAFEPTQVDELITLIGAFRREHPEPDLADAVRFAVRLEGHPVENLHREMLVRSNPDVAGMINSLANADREHQRVLEAFARSRGVQAGEDEADGYVPGVS